MTPGTNAIMKLLADNSTEFCKQCKDQEDCEKTDRFCKRMIVGSLEGWNMRHRIRTGTPLSTMALIAESFHGNDRHSQAD